MTAPEPAAEFAKRMRSLCATTESGVGSAEGIEDTIRWRDAAVRRAALEEAAAEAEDHECGAIECKGMASGIARAIRERAQG